MDALRVFYEDKLMKEAVKQFILKRLEELTIEKVFKSKQDVIGIYEAVEALNSAFDKLDDMYQTPKPSQHTSTR